MRIIREVEHGMRIIRVLISGQREVRMENSARTRLEGGGGLIRSRFIREEGKKQKNEENVDVNNSTGCGQKDSEEYSKKDSNYSRKTRKMARKLEAV
jgi:hypothetical protein